MLDELLVDPTQAREKIEEISIRLPRASVISVSNTKQTRKGLFCCLVEAGEWARNDGAFARILCVANHPFGLNHGPENAALWRFIYRASILSCLVDQK
ncbi:MAG: hypothetical protein R2881_03110 [Eubacteriales bacterium]